MIWCVFWAVHVHCSSQTSRSSRHNSYLLWYDHNTYFARVNNSLFVRVRVLSYSKPLVSIHWSMILKSIWTYPVAPNTLYAQNVLVGAIKAIFVDWVFRFIVHGGETDETRVETIVHIYNVYAALSVFLSHKYLSLLYSVSRRGMNSLPVPRHWLFYPFEVFIFFFYYLFFVEKLGECQKRKPSKTRETMMNEWFPFWYTKRFVWATSDSTFREP